VSVRFVLGKVAGAVGTLAFAERLGILDRCRGEDLGLLIGAGGHAVACHART
jgi:hypothetical protein